MQQIYRRAPVLKCDFNKIALQLNWNHTSAWVFSCKFAAYFQNTSSWEHLWRTASVFVRIMGVQLGETHYGNSSGNFHWTKETIRIKKVVETESQITESTEYCLIQTFMLFWHFQTICLYHYYIITSLFKALDILI